MLAVHALPDKPLMFGDNNSLLSLDPNWHPAAGSNYALKDLVNYALGK